MFLESTSNVSIISTLLLILGSQNQDFYIARVLALNQVDPRSVKLCINKLNYSWQKGLPIGQPVVLVAAELIH